MDYVTVCTYGTLFDDPVHDLETNPGMGGTYATAQRSSPFGLERLETDLEVVQGWWREQHQRSTTAFPHRTERHRHPEGSEKRRIKVWFLVLR